MTLIIKKFELEEFYIRWNEKAEAYGSNTLSDCFDKFFTLFVIFNKIYNVVVIDLIEKGKLSILKDQYNLKVRKRHKKEFPYEGGAATTCIAYYLRSELSSLNLSIETEIHKIKVLLINKEFQISFSYGDPSELNDKELLNKLRSSENFEIFESMLKVLYNLRCNLFHGEKGFHPDQRMILEPAISALSKINNALISKIKQDM
ncbi:hypothetical protein [Adhaeribacter soli]|uniref:Apea-like HEPN domain-containing protein n=1 Tax=Adhaeribacter soli TaxID=2607655 RepID=A0A5N1ITW6_9BACT|nr:hypothetical protein [Adhaeribacter soli]KAA9331786.1 hypothetical protein F0P94_13325 [Adhaeribacter soli]